MWSRYKLDICVDQIQTDISVSQIQTGHLCEPDKTTHLCEPEVLSSIEETYSPFFKNNLDKLVLRTKILRKEHCLL